MSSSVNSPADFLPAPDESGSAVKPIECTHGFTAAAEDLRSGALQNFVVSFVMPDNADPFATDSDCVYLEKQGKGRKCHAFVMKPPLSPGATYRAYPCADFTILSQDESKKEHTNERCAACQKAAALKVADMCYQYCISIGRFLEEIDRFGRVYCGGIVRNHPSGIDTGVIRDTPQDRACSASREVHRDELERKRAISLAQTVGDAGWKISYLWKTFYLYQFQYAGIR